MVRRCESVLPETKGRVVRRVLPGALAVLALLGSCATLPAGLGSDEVLDVPVGTTIYAEADTVALDDYLLTAAIVVSGLEPELAGRILDRVERVVLATRDPIGGSFGASVIAEGRIPRGLLRIALRFNRDFRVERGTGLPGTVWQAGEGAQRIRIAPVSRSALLIELGTGMNSMERTSIALGPDARSEREAGDLFALASGGIAALLPVSPDASAGLSIREIRATALRDQADTEEDALLLSATLETRGRADARALAGLIRLGLIAERGRAAAAEISVVPDESRVLVGPIRVGSLEFADFVASALVASDPGEAAGQDSGE